MEFIQIVLLGGVLYLLYTQRTGQSLKPTPKSRKLILDTCALIDGRIIELGRSGFVPDELIVPEFIIHELQLLADGGDAHKRERARYGLDVVKELQDSRFCTVIINRDPVADKRATDDKLVALAKKLGAHLYTTDYNLNKVAEIEGVKVLNVNELAQYLRPVALPGEKKQVKILERGQNRNQGVGYLEDGTMIVVENAGKLVGKVVEAEVTRMHQTVAGKMLFAHLVATPKPSQPSLRQRMHHTVLNSKLKIKA